MQLDAGANPMTARPPATGHAGPEGREPDRLQLLTFYRFVAALWVLVFHLQGRLFPKVDWPLLNLANNGAYAMSFFFVLSGTVLAYGYYGLTAASGDVTRFYAARFARIYPAYAVTHLICLAWIGIPLPAEWMRWVFVNLSSALGIQAWFPHTYVGANTGTWSISCEFFFYAAFPALLPLARHLARPVSFQRATLYLALFTGFLGMVDFVFAGQGTFPLYYISPFLRLPEFVLGMVLGAALRQMPHTRPVSIWPVLGAAVVVVLASMNPAYRVGLWTRANIIVVPALAGLIFWSAAYELSHRRIARGGLWSVPRYLGESSYCYFLAQLPLLMWFDASLAHRSPLAQWAVGAPIAAHFAFAIAVLVLGIILHETVEKPARRQLLRRFADQRATPVAASARVD